MKKYSARALRIGVSIALPLCSLLLVSDARAASTNLPRSTTCSTVAACIFGISTGSGPGVEGSSSSGFGIEGISKSGRAVNGVSQTNNGVVGTTYENATTPGAGKAGVSGYDSSTNNNTYNSGVYGVSHAADGVQGRSTSGTGVYGAAIGTATGTGVYGSTVGTGVAIQAAALGGSVPNGPFQSGVALEGTTYSGGLGLAISTDSGSFFPYTGVGETIQSGSVGMTITPDANSNGNPGLIINGTMSPRECCPTTAQGAIVSGFNAMSVTGEVVGLAVTGGASPGLGAAIYAQGGRAGATLLQGATSTGTTVALLDDSGNLTIAGKLTQQGTFTSALHNRDGSYSASYTAHSTNPAVEDVGEANVVAGASFVALDPALAKSIDVSRGYLVFLTPQGSTTGLYVSAKSALGFSVREIGNARDSLAFDYRIVARPYGETGQRLAPMKTSLGMPATHAPMFYRHLKPLRFVHGNLDATSLPKPTM